MSKAEFSLPRCRCHATAPSRSSATSWPVPNQRVDERAVRDRAGCREVVLLVHGRQRALGVDAALPERLPSARANASTTKMVFVGGRRGRPPPSAARPGAAASPPWTSRGALAPDPGADLRRHVHAVAADDGRRDAGAGDRGFPGDILGCAPFGRHPAIRRDAAGVRAAPVRPIRSKRRRTEKADTEGRSAREVAQGLHARHSTREKPPCVVRCYHAPAGGRMAWTRRAFLTAAPGLVIGARVAGAASAGREQQDPHRRDRHGRQGPRADEPS